MTPSQPKDTAPPASEVDPLDAKLSVTDFSKRPIAEIELFVRERRPGEHDFKIAYRMGPNASAGVAEVYGSNIGITPEVAEELAYLLASAPKLKAQRGALLENLGRLLIYVTDRDAFEAKYGGPEFPESSGNVDAWLETEVRGPARTLIDKIKSTDPEALLTEAGAARRAKGERILEGQR